VASPSITRPAPQVALVTGGAGFVGRHLIQRLVDEFPDTRVISVDNYFTGSVDNHVLDERVQYITASSLDLNRMWDRRRLPSPDVTFHLGEYSRIVQSFADFDDVWEFNIRGTKEVVTFCHEHGSLLVYAGSSSKFASEGAEHLSPYSWTKAKNIEYIRNFASWFGLDYVISYFYNVYGPGQIGKGSYATVIGIFEEQAANGEPLTVVEPGTQTRDFTHIDDIVEGLVLCYLHGEGDGYELGTSQDWQILEVARMFSEDIKMIPMRQGERTRGKADTSKARSIGWEPKRSLPDYAKAWRESLSRS
jgi:UDP-glucose 4-epimerase